MKDYIEVNRRGRHILVRVQNIKMIEEGESGLATLSMNDGWSTTLDDRYETVAEAIIDATESPVVPLSSFKALY